MKTLKKVEKQLNIKSLDTALELWSRLKTAVDKCYRIDEVINWRNEVEAIRYACIQAKGSPEIIRQMMDIKLRAERKAGELLREEGRKQGERDETFQAETFAKPKLEELGINRVQSHRWQKIASIPEEKFEEFLVNEEELSSARAVSLAKNLEREKRRVETIQPELNKEKKYRIVYADPPWPYRADFMDNYGHVGAHYATMTMKEICELGIDKIAEDDAVLFLWVPSPKLEQAFEIIRAWGFSYKTSMVWDKRKHNFGYYVSVRHEFLLIAGRGKSTPDVKELHDSVVSIERSSVHSEKPDYFRELIDRFYPRGKRIELFARKRVEGWDVWGAEV